MNKIRKRLSLWNKNSKCFVCERSIDDFSDATLEHITPLAFGGRNSDENISISHKFCNELKGSLRFEHEWKKKLREHEDFCRIALWRKSRSDCYIHCLFRKGFSEIVFVSKSMDSFLKYYNQTLIPKKDLKYQLNFLKELKKIDNLDDLIESSKNIDLYKTQQYWKIIYGIVFIELYTQTGDLTSMLHAIWRLSSFLKNSDSWILYCYAQSLLDYCHSAEPEAYGIYINLYANPLQPSKDPEDLHDTLIQ